MNIYLKTLLVLAILSIAFTSCREEKTAEETASEMIENGDQVKVKEDKVKIENEDGSETKIKYDEFGSVEKIKTDDN
ncbi:hypothetical protein LX97_00791 [Nonlabens dokdonensis]|jgi:hypothetical protein|uniref:Lipoprotein n=2 Tax=Nonlabens dokdonensis TaxID=328515 RepID=L7W8H9_NONDD|nr:hypothetical protein [Nonlabens dokdonensis]AGC76116.1 hypothetical protein DDD_0989 [Nonlabens dokdonensis DSW-6]PZX43787.1 hypothetical protein LX97_00791 [Nonlabens dokdonensis]